MEGAAAVPVGALALAAPRLDEDGVDDDDDDEDAAVVKGGKLEDTVGSLCGKGRRRYGGSEAVASAAERREDGGEKMWSKRVRSDAAGPPTPTPAAKGGDGMPVNSCTMARKLEVSVVSTVVGGRREALGRFLAGFAGAAGGSGGTGGGGGEGDDVAAAGEDVVGRRPWKEESRYRLGSWEEEEDDGGGKKRLLLLLWWWWW